MTSKSCEDLHIDIFYFNRNNAVEILQFLLYNIRRCVCSGLFIMKNRRCLYCSLRIIIFRVSDTYTDRFKDGIFYDFFFIRSWNCEDRLGSSCGRMGETVIPVGKHDGDLKRIRGGGDAA